MVWQPQLVRRVDAAGNLELSLGHALVDDYLAFVAGYQFRGAQISTPYNIDEVNPDGARFRRTSHDDVAFVGQVSEYLA
ncbi:hypothetical protein [Nonomuraea sp. bgisy101]|uniref:hypothetical protein n=1 Tax=Nonomuraea sp. bgisy101 TaxID=3413784 RepID=UPI003D715197